METASGFASPDAGVPPGGWTGAGIGAETAPRIDAQPVAWEPNPGTQELLVSCTIPDILFGGARGGGKSWGLLGDWLIHAAEYGADARGIVFRRTYDELDEIQAIARKIFPLTGAVFHGNSYLYGSRVWVWPSGASLKLRYLDNDDDADHYQGHSYTWIGIDEAGNFPSPTPIDLLRATLRSGAGVPCVLRLTANPGGVGHNWIKSQYIDPAPEGLRPFYSEEGKTWRVFIPSLLDDNPALLQNDPEYWKRIEAATVGNPALLKAWRYGLWDIVAGGMFDDLFIRTVHIIQPFAIPFSWVIDRAFDWGSSKPYSVGFWAESDGTAAPNGRIYPPGTLFAIGEIYGWNGRPNEGLKQTSTEIAEEVLEYEAGANFGAYVQPGPADPSIFTRDHTGTSIADAMELAGVRWTPADNSPGSRKMGWEEIRRRLRASLRKTPDGLYVQRWPMETPGLFVFSTCPQWIRTVPALPRDRKKPDDVDTHSEDHIGDMSRYRVLNKTSEGALI